MASTSSSSQRSSSPPPSTSSSSPPLFLPRHPLSPPRTYSLEEISRKRRRVEEQQDASLIHGFDLQPHANKILQSEDLSKLQSAIEDFVNSPAKKKIEPKRIFDSLALHYPNSFSLKLAKLLNLQPPLNIRTEAMTLLHQILTETHGYNMRKINASILTELKTLLLEFVTMEYEESLFPLLFETIGNVASRVYEYPLGGWEELLEYACSSVSGDSKLNHRKGFMLIAELPLKVADSREFWVQGNYTSLVANVLNYSGSTDQKLQELKFDASLVLMGLSINIWRTRVGASLLPMILEFIDHYAKEKTVVGRVQNLAELISLDVDGEIFNGKEGDVFWGMLRLLEMKGACEALRCTAIHVLKELDDIKMNVMENLIKNLSPMEVKRFLSLSMDMLLCIKDDPLWYEVDNEKCKEAGMSESYTRGKFLLRWLSLGGDASIVVPTVFEMVRETYVADEDWRKRHAGMMALGTIADLHKKDMIQHFEQVERLVLTLLNDLHPRVIWAAIHVTKCLSGYKELVPNVQYHMKFLAKLVSIIKSSPCHRVQGYAVIVIRFFVTNFGLDGMASFGEEIVTILLLLLKNEKQKLQEEAVETLALIAVSIPANFRKYYDAAMDSLIDILFHNSSLPNLLLRAKCLECMSSIVLRVEQDKLEEQEAVLVMESLLSLVEELRSTDYLIRNHILKALHQFFQCPTVDIDKFMNEVMPMLLRSAQLDIDINDDSLDFDKYLVETGRLRACNILSYCAVRSSRMFSPNISKVSKIFVRWLGCSSFETQKASILALQSLLRSVLLGVQDEQSQKALTAFIVQSLVEALHKETDKKLLMRMLKSIPRCIQISGPVFTTQLIKMIADEINQLLCKIMEMEKAQETGTSEGGGNLPDEKFILRVHDLIKTTIGTFEARFLPYVDDFMSTAALLWGDDFPDRVKAFAISIFNIIVQQFPEKLQMYHDQYTSVLLKAFRDENSHAQLEAARGIGFCAMFGGHKFKTTANVAISSLCSVIKRFSTSGGSGDSTRIYDTSVSALGKICEFHRENIEGPKVIPTWLNFLPLTSDSNEARYAHGLLSKMLQRSEADLLGPNNENLPKILSILREILSRTDNLEAEETIREMTDFLNQHGGMPL